MKSETKVESGKSTEVESGKSKVESVSLGSVAAFDRTAAILKERNGLPYISLEDIDSTDGNVRIAERADPKSTKFVFSREHVLFGKLRPNLRMVARPNFSGICSTDIIPIRPSDKLDRDYLFHYLRTPAVTELATRLAVGINLPRLSPKLLSTFALPLPPFKAQRRIASILDRAEALRAKRRAALALLDELTQSIFLDMFGDPVSNPKRWDDSKTLADVASIGSGITKGRRTTEPVRTIPYMAVVNVQDKMLDLSVVKTIDATEKEIERYRLKKNDLLLTEGGDADKLGRGTLWSEELPECIHQNHIFRVRIESKDVSPLFLNWLVGGPRGKSYFLRQAKQTTGIATINMTQLKSFPMLIPPLDVQHEFANRIQRLEGIRMEQTSSLTQLDQLFASLQHRAFRGEL